MTNSRAYVKHLLIINGKENSATCKGIKEAPESSGSINEIRWGDFSKKEVNQISKMVLNKTPELSYKALESKTAIAPAPEVENWYRGPEPW